MALKERIANIKRVYTTDKNVSLVQGFLDFCQIRASLKALETPSETGDELIIIFEGESRYKDESRSDIFRGFCLNESGTGSLYLPSSEFLYSFGSYIIRDLGKVQPDKGWIRIPFQPAFSQLRTAYDYFLTQEGRVTKGLNRSTYIRRLAEQGITHAEVNGLGFPMGLENGPKGETYSMFYTYCPAMDQFVSSTLNKGLYPAYYLSRNLSYLKSNAEMAVKNGLKPGMLSFEPRSVPDSFFDRYPMLRGARVDHPFRSFRPRYNMTTTHPMVLEHYREMTQKLLREVPELSFFTIWSNDSGAGFEYTKSLYVGRNGGAYLVREWKDDEEIARLAGQNVLNFMNCILEARREINPGFKVITRLESFYGELDTVWGGLRNGLEVETNSLVAKGWQIPYKHSYYPESGVLNGCGLHHQDLDPQESVKYHELKSRNSAASFYFGMGPQVMFAPLMGIPYPKSVWNRLKKLNQAGIRDLVIYGGTFPEEKVPYFVNYEVVKRFQYASQTDFEVHLNEIADKYSGGVQPDQLISAWSLIEKAVVRFPNVSTLYNTIGFAWYRLWTRPLVPDLEAVSDEERKYYEEMMCTTPHNPNNVDLSRDVLFEIASVKHCGEAVGLIDELVLPPLSEAINLLESLSIAQNPESVFFDLLIRTKALKCYLTTHRNVAAWISSVHGYLQSPDPDVKKRFRDQLDQMIGIELENMDELHDLFDRGVEFIALMEEGESPLMYGTNITQQIRLKQDLMRKHRHDEPSINQNYMITKAGELLK